MANDDGVNAKGSVVFIDNDKDYMMDVKRPVRFVLATEYGITNDDMLYGFLAGALSQNYDIEVIYLDAFRRITGKCDSELEDFLTLRNNIWHPFPPVSMLIMYVRSWREHSTVLFGNNSPNAVWDVAHALMFVQPVPVLIFRKMPKVRPVIVSVVGILAAFRCLPSIRPDIIRARHKAPVGVSAFCISSPICLNGYRKPVVPDAGVVRVPAR